MNQIEFKQQDFDVLKAEMPAGYYLLCAAATARINRELEIKIFSLGPQPEKKD